MAQRPAARHSPARNSSPPGPASGPLILPYKVSSFAWPSCMRHTSPASRVLPYELLCAAESRFSFELLGMGRR